LRDDRTTRRLLAGGVIGPLVFMVVAFVAGAFRPGYDPWRAYVSMLSLGDGGFVQVISFLVTGALLIAFAAGLLRRGERTLAILAGTVGLAVGLQGVFAADPGLGYPPGAPLGVPPTPTPVSAVHYLLGFLAALAFVALAAATARMFGRDRRSSGWARYSAITAVLSLALFVALVVAGRDGPTLQSNAGAIQRAWMVVGFSWLALAALRLTRRGLVERAAL
jgi:hypothetical membrane protein